jgi:arylsulfatase A-like enzyme
MVGDLNRWFKGAMYEGSARIPLLMKAPAGSRFAASFNRGTVVSQIVENIDVMPTLCEMIGVPLPTAGIQGRSMTALVAGQAEGWKNRAFAERNSSMIRTPQFKYINNTRTNERRGGGKPELYDLTKDPLEMNNLAADPAYGAVVKDLAGQLDQWQQDRPAVPVIPGVALPPRADTAESTTKAGRKTGRANRNQK